MESKISNFLRKHNFQSSDVMYLVRDGRKSSIHLSDSKIITTYIPIKTFLDYFNSDFFITINKGITINTCFVKSIENSIYTMYDGTAFKGRTRFSNRFKNNSDKISCAAKPTSNIPELFSVMDNSPIPFTAIQVICDENGSGVDFVFRYCNSAMLSLEELSADEILNKSFYDVFTNSDHKWMVSFADVALNGNNKIIAYHLRDTERKVLAYCYRPCEGFCACTLIEIDEVLKAEANI